MAIPTKSKDKRPLLAELRYDDESISSMKPTNERKKQNSNISEDRAIMYQGI
jgi:hypothetical protein